MKISNLGHDILGGTMAAILSVPLCLAYAVIIFQPLGGDAIPIGIVSCIIALALSNLVSTAVKGSLVFISGTYALTVVMLSETVALIIEKTTSHGEQAMDLNQVLMFFFFVVMASGCLQFLFGLFRIGYMAKFIPLPVISGLKNGTSLLIIYKQIWPILGLNKDVSLYEIPGKFGDILWPNVFIGILTIIVILKGNYILKKIPPTILGIVVGTSAWYGFQFIGADNGLTEVVGRIPNQVPMPKYALSFFTMLTSGESLLILVALLPSIVGIAIVNTLQSMVVLVIADNAIETRSNSNRELLGQGISNMVSGLFGGVANTGMASTTLVNVANGGKGRVSRYTCGVFALLTLLALAPVLGMLPKVVLAGALVALAATIRDKSSISLLFNFIKGSVNKRSVSKDLTVILLVMCILLKFGSLYAVGAGVMLSIIHFLFSMSKNIIRREYLADIVRSNFQRNDHDNMLLTDKLGAKIKILELEGPLFFGTSDRLAEYIETVLKEDISIIILDFQRVPEIDSTAVNLLIQSGNLCQKNNVKLLFSSIESKKDVALSIKSSRLPKLVSKEYFFNNIDDVLGWAEDYLLEKELGIDRDNREYLLKDMDIFSSMDEAELVILQQFLERLEFDHGQRIFDQGDKADGLFFLTFGRADIIVSTRNLEPDRLRTLCSGNVFGEMAILDGKTRSAAVHAFGDVVCHKLSIDNLQLINREHPEIIHKLLANLGQELAKRLRISNRIVTELKA